MKSKMVEPIGHWVVTLGNLRGKIFVKSLKKSQDFYW